MARAWSVAALVHLTRAFISGDSFLGALELPRAGTSLLDILAISGWTYSRRAPVQQVEAFLGSLRLDSIPYGLARPDVARTFPWLDIVRSGYEARIPLPPSIGGRHVLAVRVTDQHGQVKEYRRTIAVRTPFRPAARLGAPLLELEQANWRARTLEVGGWALWPGATPPLTVDVSLGGVKVGGCRVRLSRPDIAERFAGEPEALRSGFRLSVTLAHTVAGTGAIQPVPLQLELGEASGHRFGRSIMIRSAASGHGTAELWSRVEGVFDEFETRYGRPPAILDWNAGLDAVRCGSGQVFSPSVADASDSLPYADSSVDIVVVARRDRVGEATRVASAAIVIVEAEQIATAWSADFRLPPLPRVSIIIPVHGHIEHTEACLQQLWSTLPSDFSGEILVVDDASTDRTAQVLANLVESGPHLKVMTNELNLGFSGSCNRAARAANGDVLVFLNNDTLPQAGWLPPLLAPLRDPHTGAVGAKLLYPGGSLQEAGGVIFADGTGWNFGKGERDPDAPPFNHVREVDYCSGAVLATPRSLYLELGGFDERFSPAYYEDTDYCFKLRARGCRTLYQPASVVVHVEGATSGIDERVGIKSAQVTNRAAFLEKWSDALKAQPPAPDRLDRTALYRHAVRGRSTRRALVWAPRVPEYDRESGSRRVFDTIRYLRDAGWAVTFIAESATGGRRYMSMLEQMGVSVYAGRDSSGAGSEYLPDASELLRSSAFDLALLHFWWLAERHLQMFRSCCPSTLVIVDSVDLAFLRRTRSKYRARTGLADVLDPEDATLMMRELNVYAAADGVLTVSAQEADFINGLFADWTRAHVVQDAEDLRQSPIEFGERCGLLFLANFRHPPNVEALTYLMTDIVPRLGRDLLVRHPISVVGNDLSESLVGQTAARRDGVQLVGWVPAVEPYLERARITIAPLCHGAGTKRKLVQAAMTGTPSVSTTIGVEGLNLVDREHVIVADDPVAFAAGVRELVDDPGLWRRLARAGREAMMATHSRELVRRRFNQVIDLIMARHSDRPSAVSRAPARF